MSRCAKVVNANITEGASQEGGNWQNVMEDLKKLLKEKGVLTWDELLEFTKKRFGSESVGYWAMTLLNLLLMGGIAENDPDENGTILLRGRDNGERSR